MKYLLIFLLSIIISGVHSGVASTPAYKVKPVENHIAVASKKVAPVTMSVQYHATAPVYVSPVPKPVVTPTLVQPTIPKTPVSDTPQSTNSAKCYTNCTDPNRPYYDQYGNEFDYMGNMIAHGNCSAWAKELSYWQTNPPTDLYNWQAYVTGTQQQYNQYCEVQ